jgi:hypothetical protein
MFFDEWREEVEFDERPIERSTIRLETVIASKHCQVMLKSEGGSNPPQA